MGQVADCTTDMIQDGGVRAVKIGVVCEINLIILVHTVSTIQSVASNP